MFSARTVDSLKADDLLKHVLGSRSPNHYSTFSMPVIRIDNKCIPMSAVAYIEDLKDEGSAIHLLNGEKIPVKTDIEKMLEIFGIQDSNRFQSDEKAS